MENVTPTAAPVTPGVAAPSAPTPPAGSVEDDDLYFDDFDLPAVRKLPVVKVVQTTFVNVGRRKPLPLPEPLE